MIKVSLQQYGNIEVGAVVSFTPRDGLHAGQPIRKTVQEIQQVSYTGEERCRLGVPQEEILYAFTDGTTAGFEDRVTKA